MSTTLLAKYKPSDYIENSGKFLTKKESSSIQHLGNAWQLSEETKQPPITYYHNFSITDF